MPDGSLLFDYRVDKTAPRRNSTVALLHLLADILPELGSADPNIRARAARHLDCILAIWGLTWDALAYVIARHGDRSAEASARLLLP